MRKLLTRALIFAALSGAGMTAFADNVSMSSTVGIPYYARGPRIIHVPQPGEEPADSQASLQRAMPDEDDDDVVTVAPPPRVAVKPRAKPQKTASRTGAGAPPRRKPYSVAVPEPPPPPPEPLGPRRALLSAPPPPLPSIHDGPTPIRPTPRFSQPLPQPASPADEVTPMPAAENAAAAPDAVDDHLPPPGDPNLAPPEPTQ